MTRAIRCPILGLSVLSMRLRALCHVIAGEEALEFHSIIWFSLDAYFELARLQAPRASTAAHLRYLQMSLCHRKAVSNLLLVNRGGLRVLLISLHHLTSYAASSSAYSHI